MILVLALIFASIVQKLELWTPLTTTNDLLIALFHYNFVSAIVILTTIYLFRKFLASAVKVEKSESFGLTQVPFDMYQEQSKRLTASKVEELKGSKEFQRMTAMKQAYGYGDLIDNDVDGEFAHLGASDDDSDALE